MHDLATYRKDNSISQRRFAELVGVDQSVISRLEAGAMSPSLLLAVKIHRETGGLVPVESWVPSIDAEGPQLLVSKEDAA